MFDYVDNQNCMLLIEIMLEIYQYIRYYRGKNSNRLIDDVVAIALNNQVDYFEIVECITSVQ